MVTILNGLSLGMLLLILASGLALIFGLRGVVNFAHGAIYMLAAYIAMTLSDHTSFWVAIVVVPLLMAAFGLLVDRFGLRYLVNRDPLEMVLLTFGVTFVINDVVQSIWGPQPRSVEAPGALAGTMHIFVSYPTYRWFLILVGTVAGALLIVWMKKSTTGLYVRAAATDRVVAGVVGVDVNRVSAVVVAVGTGLAGLAGVVAGPYLSVTPTMGVSILVLTFIVVVIGGLGSFVGPMAAALLIGMVDAVMVANLPDVAEYVPYALMLLILLFRPRGIAGTRTV